MAPEAQDGRLNIFVTVGTTRFDSLVRVVFSQTFFDAIAQLSIPPPKLVIQYGNSYILDIITSSAFARVDAGSEIIPEAGLRMINGRRVYQSSAKIPGLDPGQTGSIPGLKLRPKIQSSEPSAPAAEQAGSLFDSMAREAQALAGKPSFAAPDVLRDTEINAEFTTKEGIEVKLFPFAPNLKSYIQEADVVISHAGSGTILDTLRMRPKPPALVVVPNTSLMDNHQVELAEALSSEDYLIASAEKTLAEDVERARKTICKPFPDFDPTRFTSIVDEAMQL